MPYVDIATGARLFYDEVNPHLSTPPILAIHGMLGTGRLHLGHVMDWLGNLGYRVLAPTLRGYGDSSPKPRDFPSRFYERDTADVIAFMDALNIPQAHMIGYSDGGEITLIAAGRHPQRLLSAAAWGAVGYFGAGMREVAQRMIPGSAWLTAEEMAIHGLTDADAFARDWVRATVEMIDAGGDVSLSLAPHITCPLLMMLGDQDTLNPAAYAEQFLAKVRPELGRLAMFACGHAVHDLQTEDFRQTLLMHLKAVP